jgi:hypothetical protein
MVTLTRPTDPESPQPIEMSAGQQTVPTSRAGEGTLGRLSALVAGRAPLVALLATVVLAGAGGLGYLMLTGSGDSDTGTGAIVRTVPSHRSSPSPSASAKPAATGSPTPSTTRNPFREPGAATSGSTGGSTGTSTRTVIPTVTATRTVTSLRTATVSALYLGLYGWTSGGLPMFRINDVAATPAKVGATFGPSGAFTYQGAYTSNSLNCANVTFLNAAVALCAGEVRRVA